MGKGRLEAFSDGVIAVIITIMVLELKTPHGDDLSTLLPLLPVLLSYLLSFIYVGIYWNNHHHMMHAVRTVNGPILWANLHLLFWMSLVPFVTSWVGENHLSSTPLALYGGVLLMTAIAYTILVRLLLQHEGQESPLAIAIGNDFKGWISLVFYVAGIVMAFVNPIFSIAFYVLVALIWFIPDRRIERTLKVS